MTDDIAQRFAQVREQVAQAARRCGRQPEEVTIVCAAKTKAAEYVRAALKAGATDIGENYVQEAQDKQAQITQPARWHLIGHLQRNKVKLILPKIGSPKLALPKSGLPLFSLIHSLDSIGLAQELHRQAEKQDIVVPTLLEVNLGAETTKSGLTKDGIGPILERIATLPNVRVEGLMTIPPPADTVEASRPYFQELARLRTEYASMNGANIDLRELSMGMTNDYPIAIEEGATLVRIGRAIFGER